MVSLLCCFRKNASNEDINSISSNNESDQSSERNARRPRLYALKCRLLGIEGWLRRGCRRSNQTATSWDGTERKRDVNSELIALHGPANNGRKTFLPPTHTALPILQDSSISLTQTEKQSMSPMQNEKDGSDTGQPKIYKERLIHSQDASLNAFTTTSEPVISKVSSEGSKWSLGRVSQQKSNDPITLSNFSCAASSKSSTAIEGHNIASELKEGLMVVNRNKVQNKNEWEAGRNAVIQAGVGMGNMENYVDLSEQTQMSAEYPVYKKINVFRSDVCNDSPKSGPKMVVSIKPTYNEVWKEVYLAGTEWEQIQLVYSVDWDFDHLDEMLNEGKLTGKKVHLFGATEPQLLTMHENDKKGRVFPVPVIVAVVCEVAPPSIVGINSVQREGEELVSMSKLGMGWRAYTPESVTMNTRFEPKVHILRCNDRRARLGDTSEGDAHIYDYVLPYFIKPDQEHSDDEDTCVHVVAHLEGMAAPVAMEFDYEVDDLEEVVSGAIEENELNAEIHTQLLQSAIEQEVQATKLGYEKEREARRRVVDTITRDDREAIKRAQMLKFYPRNEWPDISGVKCKFINRYYGHATQIF